MVDTICICGAGTMGSGIAQVAAQHGFKTIQFDVDAAMVDKSKAAIKKNYQTLVDKGRLTEEERIKSLDRLYFTNDINHCKADVIIEAIIEKKEAKVKLFQQLSDINNNQVIFATNTSSLSVDSIAGELNYAERVVGMHFFNPAPIMKLVEVVKGAQTSNEVVNTVVELSKQLGKTPVVCKDVPGFIVNRVARPYYLEAMKLIESGVADVETLDKVMEASGFKMGPFKLMDLIGMDINYSVSNIVWEALGKPGRLTPSSIQKQKVDAGELGKKTGKGFYHY
jgi:3-hydroxybutyryl-CoA dehydrogenase